MNELEVKPKSKLGSGMYHSAFPFHKFQDKIIKTRSGPIITFKGDKKIMAKGPNLDMSEFEIFQQYPQFFAKVYKLTERYVVIEKLDTDSFLEDCEVVNKKIFNLCVSNPKLANSILPVTIDPIISDSSDLSTTDIIYTFVFINDGKSKAQQLSKYCQGTIYDDIVKFLFDLHETLKKPVDIHNGNFGYNKQKEIRLLDI